MRTTAPRHRRFGIWLAAVLGLVWRWHLIAAERSPAIDNDQARVLVVTSAPGAKSGLHEHQMNRVMVYLDAGEMSLTDAQGKIEKLQFKAGEALWSPATGLHTSRNLSDHPVRIVEVELKSATNRSRAFNQTLLDPVKVDSKRYHVEWENDQVRVVRAQYAPHEKGVLHEHSLNRVVTFLTDANMKVTTPDGMSKTLKASAGEVSWGGQARHIEENLSDGPFEVMVVEFKK